MNDSGLKAGDHHYKAYVGPPGQYDFMGATQFCLLIALGLRAKHHVLDVGCGSLRAGRLLISYLDEGRYFGIDPNEWLIKDAIQHQVGSDFIAIKKPQFDYNSEFATNIFSQQFDFIVAQSIFSHAGSLLISKALRNFKSSLKKNGLIAVTFVEGAEDDNDGYDSDDWVYPGRVAYCQSTIEQFARNAGLFITRIPWYHPRQAWYLLANEVFRLPSDEMMRYLRGAVLFSPVFADSWQSK